MFDAEEVTTTIESTSALAVITKDLEPSKVAMIRAGYDSAFESAARWEQQARLILSAPEDDRDSAKQAEALRKTIKKSRGVVEDKRKEMKAGLLTLGAAIDGAAKIYVAMVSETERQLEAREKFQENLKKRRIEELRSARQETLDALGFRLPVSALGEMSEQAWSTCLDDAKAAKESRERIAKEEEEARVEAARILAERRAAEEVERKKAEADRILREEAQKAENERLRAEMAVQEEARKVADELSRVEREKMAAESKTAADRVAEENRKERERLASETAAKEAELQAEKKKSAALAAKVEPAHIPSSDAEALQLLATNLRKAKLPEMGTPRGTEIVGKVRAKLEKLASDIEEAARTL